MPGAFRDNAARILPVTIDLSRTDRDAQFLAVARSVVPDWANARHAEVSVVDGGITLGPRHSWDEEEPGLFQALEAMEAGSSDGAA